MKRLVCRVSGRVHGVGFRASTARVAKTLGITGWVRNLSDGSVEIVAEGVQSHLERFHEWLQKGPEHAVVEHVEAWWEGATGEFDDFQIKRS